MAIGRAENPGSVVIVGAGPVGLALACELGRRNIPVTVLETQKEHLPHPKANTFSARTMEIFRKQGIASTVRANGGLPQDRRTDIGYFTSMTGWELFRIPWVSPADSLVIRDPEWPTPEPVFRSTQMRVEPALLSHARSFPSVSVKFNAEVVAFEQDSEGVTVTVSSSGSVATETIRTDYMVGCDGGRSTVRSGLGIAFGGDGDIQQEFMGGPMMATYLKAPSLLSVFPHADTWMHWIMSPLGRGIIVTIDPDNDEFLVHFQLKPDEEANEAAFADRFPAIIGQEIPYEIISMAKWRAGLGLVAEAYGKDRVFLAGDAIHLFTPTGGMGVNTGIEDAFNLGWKLAAACKGVDGVGLLASYECERRPIGLRNTGFALGFAQLVGGCPIPEEMVEEGLEGDAARAKVSEYLSNNIYREFKISGFQLGARYDGTPLIVGDGESAPADSAETYIPSGVPGGRLPHVWLSGGESLFDRLGQDFSLICFERSEVVSAWEQVAASVWGAALGPLTVLELQEETELHLLLNAAAVLVRPDQHIAWRGSLEDSDPLEVLETVIGLRNVLLNEQSTTH